MASIKDQVGAMAVIDSLRLEQMQIQENLDLPKRRAAVAAKIREYYSSSGVAVDDALVEAGVKKYFDARLRFVDPEVGSLQRKTADFFMHLDETLRLKRKNLAFSALVIALVMGVASYAPVFIEGVADDLYKQAVLVPVQKLHSDASRNLAALEVLLAKPATIQSPLLREMGESLKQRYETLARDLSTGTWYEPETGKPDSLDETKKDFYLAKFRPLEELYAQAGRDAGRFESLVYAYTNFLPLTQPGAVENLDYLSGKLASLKRVSTSVTEVFSSPVVPSEIVLEEVTESLSFFNSFKDRVTDLERTLKGFDGMGDSVYAQPDVSRLMTVLSNAIDKRDGWEASRAVSKLDRTLAFAREPLTFRIVSRSGVKSGVIRTPNDFADSRGIPYLIVESLDVQGRPFEVSVMDAEMGEVVTVHTFGVRVTHDQFERVKLDKMDDGLIENNLIGEKGANTFKINFDSRVTSDVKMITRW